MSAITRNGALDGLRGVAVVAVVLFHTGASWASGGFLGVSLFFTLSGYLITTQLLTTHEQHNSIALSTFWNRRFRRLWPAAALTIAAIFIANMMSRLYSFGELSTDAAASLGSVANWRFLLAGTSYQDLFEAPSPFLHFWSLAIEEQFYLLFPLLAVVCLKISRTVFGIALAALLGISLVTQLVVESHDAIYFSTPTRMGEVLIGALGALWMFVAKQERLRTFHPALGIGGLVSVPITLAAWVLLSEGDEVWDRGGFFAISILSITMVLAVSQSLGILPRVLDNPVLKWLGLRSYGIYLFHWPIFVMAPPTSETNFVAIEWAARIVVTLACAEVSYRVVEMPIRVGTLVKNNWWQRVAVASCAMFLVFGVTAWQVDEEPDRFAFRDTINPFVVPTENNNSVSDTTDDPTTVDVTTTTVEPTPLLAVFGDSTAAAAADGLARWSETSREAFFFDISKPSCSIAEYSDYRQSPNEPIRERDDECQWRTEFDQWLGGTPPDVIAIVGGTSEVVDFTTVHGGSWTNITKPRGYEFLQSEFTELASQIRQASPTSRLVLTTAPYNDWQYCKDPCLTHDRNRFDLYNQLVDELVNDSIFDALIPYGEHINEMDLQPTDPFRPDGVHLSEDGSYADAQEWFGPALLAEK